MKRFLDLKASKQLLKLAKNPYDLTELTPDRFKNYMFEACGYQLHFATERIDDQVLTELFALASETEVFAKMKMMQEGARVNHVEHVQSEDRPALHTATRDFFENQIEEKPAKKARELAYQEIEKLQKFLKKTNQFDTLIQIGIGGSYLGPEAHYIALKHLSKKGRSVHFIANVDPDEAAALLQKTNLAKTLVLVVSKTGTTLETATNEAWVRSYLKQKGLDPKQHMVSITMPGSPMDNKEQYLECFHIWDWVGGRYSTTSMVGGVMLAWALGFEHFWEFLKGANAMDKLALTKALKSNLPLLAALLGIWNRNFLNHSSNAIIPYSHGLHRYPAHIQQLDMESNGKRIDKEAETLNYESGPIIWGEPGTNAQHSFFQLLHQGTTVVPIEFVGYRESQLNDDFEYEGTSSQKKLLANLFAQIIALATGHEAMNPNKEFPGNRPSHLLLGQQLTPYSLGALLAFYEHKVAFQGFIWNINSFDQEGVQLGKTIANKIIRRFKDKTPSDPLVEAILSATKV